MRKNSGKIVSILIIILIIAGAAALAYKFKNRQGSVITHPENVYKPGQPDVALPTHALLNVPFTSQAPLAHWEDPRQEDGCEEASILMAWLWVNGKTLTPVEAEKEIIAISDFEQEKYGNYHDFNAQDTAKLMKDYYGYDKFLVVVNPSIDDVKKELAAGHVVLTPTNGQKLANPHYKQPGPYTHMLVIKGFDDDKGEFITNDPGTRFGEGYTYSYQKVYESMVNYPSGIHEDQTGRPKAMIVVYK